MKVTWRRSILVSTLFVFALTFAFAAIQFESITEAHAYLVGQRLRATPEQLAISSLASSSAIVEVSFRIKNIGLQRIGLIGTDAC